MRLYSSNMKGVTTMWLLLIIAGCGTSPADQFKPIADRKKAQLQQFLDKRHSKLWDYKATVTEETNVERRLEATHVGLIEFAYSVTQPVGEHESTGLDTVVAEYRFSAKEKKWVYKGCILKLPGTIPDKEKERLISYQDVVAAFEKD
jgi:hypothetical protein